MKIDNIDISNFLLDPHYHDIKKLYYDSFPFFERFPWICIKRSAKKKVITITKFISQNELIAFTMVINDKERRHLAFFAVDKAYRNQGIGSDISKYLINRYKDNTFYLCAEYYPKDTPKDDVRVKRVNFYLRNGLSILPFIINEFGIDYYTMSNGKNIEFSSHKKMMKKSLGILYSLIYKASSKKLPI